MERIKTGVTDEKKLIFRLVRSIPLFRFIRFTLETPKISAGLPKL